MNPVETASTSISLFDRLKHIFIRVRIVPGAASYQYIEASTSKYTQVGASFHIENKNPNQLLISDARALVKSPSGKILEAKASFTQNDTLEPYTVSDKTLVFIFHGVKFTNEKTVRVVLHLNAKKVKSFDLELIPIERYYEQSRGTINDKTLAKQRRKLHA